jgi:hypothetical protein
MCRLDSSISITSAGTVGSGKVVWDGDHGFPGTVDPTGLGGIDLLGSGTGVTVKEHPPEGERISGT